MINFPYILGGGQKFTFDANGYFQYPETVIVPNTVRYIPSNSEKGFYKHSEVKHIIYEDGDIPLVSNGVHNFQDCTGLIDCILPERFISGTASGNKYMPYFQGCTSLKNVTFPSAINAMSETFHSCSGLETMTVPDTITYFGNYVFRYCTSLESVTLSANLTEIGCCTFERCTSLKTVIFKSSPTSSYLTATGGYNNFYNCTALEDVQFPAGWTESIVISTGSSNFTNVLTHDSMVAMIANLYDYSGGTAHTLRLGATNLARLSEEEIAVATAKNWTLS